jgi:thioredoxin 1
VKELKTDQEYRSVLQEAAKTNALSVFDYTASWCGPCRMISPVVDKLSTEYADENVTFYKVDIDRETVHESVREAGVASVPTFSFYRGGKMIATFSGADRRQLENNLVNLVSLGG